MAASELGTLLSDDKQIQSQMLSEGTQVGEMVHKCMIECIITDCGKWEKDLSSMIENNRRNQCKMV